MQKITLNSVVEKFEDKGFTFFDFRMMISFPTIFVPYISIWTTEESLNRQLARHAKNVEEELDYLNTWIDYQNYR